ncbi:MAG: rhodanese-like domain-containing protein [Sandaracinaceae bacterium]|jgi:rhodanese-related sulfurtransferase|nr:rhodanese-like domain-containing protein [Sandaracinaceae bacterium]MBP7681169.1 rhodanese-like domain-containing protein [Deltaproteobacteria bacterium]MBK6808885.1 rhodanese-like domain-containing protein [Sandaracinaceae bacterium]MBK7153310.1 rhodanese-like domain-containing protein [Sandaracinaceae bacterium]MBK7772782.1 rhodanese-like domain-containing protein [Sandaracinaceae bacterium]
MKRKLPLMLLVAVLSGLSLVAVSAAHHDRAGLAAVRSAVDARYPGVQWVSAESLTRWLASSAPPQLLDSRARAEFDVSHLAGAVWMDPEHPDWSVVDSNPARRVVVYCSVGWRSGDIAQQLRARGRANVFNLEQGLFGWANAGLPMVRGDSAATQVHPYDAVWGRMLRSERRAPLP